MRRALLGPKVAGGKIPPIGTPTVTNPGDPVTPPPATTWPRVLIGMSTDQGSYTSRQAKWAAVDDEIAGYMSQAGTPVTGTVQQIRHTFNEDTWPASWATSPARVDPGLGCKASLLNCGAHVSGTGGARTWVQTGNEYDDWKAAGRPDPTTNAAKYVYGNGVVTFVRSARDNMPAGHHLFASGLHEPGLTDERSTANDPVDIWGDATDTRRYFHPDSQLQWRKMQAYITELCLAYGNGRVTPVSVLQGADNSTQKWPTTGGGAHNGVQRTLDQWNYASFLNAAQLKDTVFAFDAYFLHPAPKPGVTLESFNNWRIKAGFGRSGLAETGKPEILTAAGAFRAGEPTLLARNLGDPTYADGFRHYFDNNSGWAFCCWFESAVMNKGTVDPNNVFMQPYPRVMAAWGQFARGLDYKITGLASGPV